MIRFITTILKFDSKGEKSGWTYIEVKAEDCEKLKAGNKKSFRVKGKIDEYSFKQVALLPMGEGSFIMPLNSAIRKAIGKRKGAMVNVIMALDESDFLFSPEMIACLEDDAKAMKGFKNLKGSEQKYFSKWIDAAKTDATKAKRIVAALNAFCTNQGYGEMIRSMKK